MRYFQSDLRFCQHGSDLKGEEGVFGLIYSELFLSLSFLTAVRFPEESYT